jgi:putative two-component system response regulator
MLHRIEDPPVVLIVDDSEEQVRFLGRLLTADGYRCQSVLRSSDAVAACAAGGIDIVLLDVHMPGVDGLTVCRQLKATPETCLIPVLVMTGDSARESHSEALEAGADDFLEKPLELRGLRARLRSASRLKRYVDELDHAAASILMLGAAIEARDRHTNGHCQRLAEYASALGRRIGLDRHDLRALEQGGYVHDLGKVAVADAVLFKPGPLTPQEFEIVKVHPLTGERICAPLRTLERARPIIRSHHETLDGKGYPDGLRGGAVPLLAQVTAIADVYDALTSDRPYRPALASATAFEILCHEAAIGKRDPALVNEFVSIVSSASVMVQAAPCDAGSTAAAVEIYSSRV